MYKGFNNFNLSKSELLVLEAFDHYGEIACIEYTLSPYFSSKELHIVLASLRYKQLICPPRANTPIKLTKTGKIIKNAQKNSDT